MITVTTQSALPDVVEGVAPEWVHLAVMGAVYGVDGRGPWKIENARHVQDIIAASKKNPLIPVDVNHATHVKSSQGEETPARGWIVDFEARSDGIWGRVDWTPSGAQAVASKEYRSISPEWSYDTKTNRILSIVGAGLTNKPNIKQLHALNTQEDQMDLAPLRAKLGLPESADMTAILAALDAKDTAIATHSQATTEVTNLAGQVVALQTQLSTLQAASRKVAATAVIDAAIAAGKPIVALRDHMIARHVVDPTSVETELAAMPSINAGIVTHAQKPGSPSGDDLEEATEEEKKVAQAMGKDPKELAKLRKARAMGGK